MNVIYKERIGMMVLSLVMLILMTLALSDSSAKSKKALEAGKKVESIHDHPTTLPNPQQRVIECRMCRCV